MSEMPHTTTFLRGGESVLLRFCTAVPDFSVTYAPPAPAELDRNSEEMARLQAELGHTMLELSRRDEEIHELQIRIAYLEAQQNPAVETAKQVGHMAVREETINTSVSTNGASFQVQLPEHNETALNGHNPSKPTKLEIDLAPDPALSLPHQCYERAILYLLGSPDLSVKGANAGGFLKKELGIKNISEWSTLRTRLEELGIIAITKSTPTATRTNGISLNIEGLVANIGKPFITPRILNTIRQASEAGHELEDTEPALGEGHNGNNPYVISPRVRKSLEREPDPVPGYRVRGKKPRESGPFLEHRRKVRGAKRR